jgi:hypothetical protein
MQADRAMRAVARRVHGRLRGREALAANERYVAKLYGSEPETRWFHRHLLRRRVRWVLIHAGPCDSFDLELNLNQISNATFVLRDPFEDLARG